VKKLGKERERKMRRELSVEGILADPPFIKPA